MKSGVEIIIIGKEILLGARRDANVATLAQFFAKRNIPVERVSIVADEERAIVGALRAATSRLVVTTGGLGPTRDDRTIDALAKFAGTEIRHDEKLHKRVTAKFAKRGRKMNERYRRFCRLPAGAKTFPNSVGIAEGILLPCRAGVSPAKGRRGRSVLALPGVPAELDAIISSSAFRDGIDRIFPRRDRLPSFEIGIYDLPETSIEDTLLDLPEFQRGEISILPSQGAVYLITQSRQILSIVKRRLKDRIFTQSGERLEDALVRLLKRRGETVAVAESCTGGSLGERITRVSGASAIFLGGIVCYSNASKIKHLNIPKQTLDRHGAVSEETARALARNVRKTFAATWGISITGIAGPGGGSKAKPVGTVFIAIASSTNCRVERRQFPSDRTLVRERTIMTALGELWRQISSDR